MIFTTESREEWVVAGKKLCKNKLRDLSNVRTCRQEYKLMVRIEDQLLRIL